MAEAHPPGIESQSVNGRIFEGLFVRALRAEGAFASDLRALGVDLARLETHYPLTTWFAALELARRRLHPGLPVDEGLRRLGRAFVDGFAHTLVGSVLLSAAPFLGPARFIARFPRMLDAARPGGIRASARVLGPREWLLVVEDRFAAPDFHAGVVEAALAHCRAPGRVVIQGRTAEGFTLHLTW